MAIAGLLPITGIQAQENPEQSYAGQTLEEVTVTAQKREESLQDAPISIIAFNNEKLEKMGVTDIVDIQNAVPNVTFSPFFQNKNSVSPYIRGVGNADIQVTKDPAVGVYLDGVYLGRSAGLALDVADLERIEILRGPQGTLYGRNSTGGAVNLTSVKPQAEGSFAQTLSVGDKGYWRSVTKGNYAISDELFVRAAYATSEKDGWIENTGGGNDFGADDKDALRVALAWQPNDDWTIDYTYDQSSNTSTQLPYQLIEDHTGSLGFIATGKRLDTLSVNNLRDTQVDVSGHGLTIAWDNDGHIIKSITASRELEEDGYQDYSASWHHLGGGAIPSLVGSGAEYLDTDFDKQQEQFSQEFQFIGDLLDGRLQYTSGLYYFREEGSENQITYLNALRLASLGFDATPSVLDSFTQADFTAWALWSSAEDAYAVDVESESKAIYGQYAYTPQLFDDDLTVTLGLRYTEDRREASKASNLYNGFAGGAVYGERESDNFSKSLTFDYALNEDANVYAKYAEGYRAGGFNARGSQANFANGFDPEEMTSFELGFKSELLDRRMRLNAALFNYSYENLQVDQSDPVNITQTDTLNAGEASYMGFEADLTALLGEHFKLTASYGYVDAEYDEYIQDGEDVADDRRIAFTPEHSYSIGLDYDTYLGELGALNANLTYNWQDQQWFSSRGAATREATGLLNGSVSLQDVAVGAGYLRTTLWAHNLLDEEYILNSFDAGGLVLGVFGEERSFGLDVTLSF
ncbi:TonB-dependent receptor [Microbulbifer taiwanensis]|uniref:TonB-dependent receptor n=1 Tax=Microbulbifer taiwanensis TaxID=986746 RepID=UPI003613EFA7